MMFIFPKWTSAFHQQRKLWFMSLLPVGGACMLLAYLSCHITWIHHGSHDKRSQTILSSSTSQLKNSFDTLFLSGSYLHIMGICFAVLPEFFLHFAKFTKSSKWWTVYYRPTGWLMANLFFFLVFIFVVRIKNRHNAYIQFPRLRLRLFLSIVQYTGYCVSVCAYYIEIKEKYILFITRVARLAIHNI